MKEAWSNDKYPQNPPSLLCSIADCSQFHNNRDVDLLIVFIASSITAEGHQIFVEKLHAFNYLKIDHCSVQALLLVYGSNVITYKEV